MSRSERKNFLYTIIGFVVIFMLFSILIIAFSMKNNEANFEVVEESQYLKLDYDPRPFIDGKWTFSFCSEKKIVGSGQYKEEIYPFVTYFKFFFQGYDQNRPIAERYYPENQYIHPGEWISFPHTFYNYLFSKGQYLAKFRVELAIFYEEDNVTHKEILFDSVDFLIDVRGSATTFEILAVILPVASLATISLVTFLLQRFLNKRMYEIVKVWNCYKMLFIYLVRKRQKRKDRRKERRKKKKQIDPLSYKIEKYLHSEIKFTDLETIFGDGL